MHRSTNALQAQTIFSMYTHVLLQALLRLSSHCDRHIFLKKLTFLNPKGNVSDLGTLLGVIIKGVADLPVFCALHGLLHKLIIDVFMHKGARACCAALPLQTRLFFPTTVSVRHFLSHHSFMIFCLHYNRQTFTICCEEGCIMSNLQSTEDTDTDRHTSQRAYMAQTD